VRGFLSEGGPIYSSANEHMLAVAPDYLRVWRREAPVELNAQDNPKAATFTNGWRHYAFSTNGETGEVAFYVDGEQLDFGYSAIEVPGGNGKGSNGPIDYDNAPYGNSWDAAGSDDSEGYFGTNNATVIFEDYQDFCSTSLPVNFSLSPSKKPVITLNITEKCSRYEQARNAEAAGAWMVVIEKEIEETMEGDETAHNSNTKIKPLSIPVLMIPSIDMDAIQRASYIIVTRSKQTYSAESNYRSPIDTNGILCFGQEPDTVGPLGDFDFTQVCEGIIDEYRIWNAIRTPEQIKANYRLTISPHLPEYQDLSLYWKFDQEPTLGSDGVTLMTLDSSPQGLNAGMMGALPTFENQLQYIDDRATTLPTVPRTIPTLSSPIIGDGHIIVPVVPGDYTMIELKSYDPDGDDLTTVVASVPSIGSLHAIDDNSKAGTQLSKGDIIVDPDQRTESKRIFYSAPLNLDQSIAFDFTVSDGNDPILATVRLIPHVTFQPKNETHTTTEDSLSYLLLAQPSQLTQGNMRVEITQPPLKGQLYQASFDQTTVNQTTVPTLASLATELNQHGEMELISSNNSFVTHDRGIVMYQPEKDESSGSDIYTFFKYRLVDPSGLKSEEASVFIIVTEVNDAPHGVEGQSEVEVGEQVIISLQSTDVDANSDKNFAERFYNKITSFPMGGKVYQYNEKSEDGSMRGEYMDASITKVPQTISWASRVVRFSSQFSICSKDCFSWRNPNCRSNDLYAGGWEDGTCSETSWHASAILGEPDIYPQYGDNKLGWEPHSNNGGHEFLELEYPFDTFLTSFGLYEVFNPGALWRISTTNNYIDNTEKHCFASDSKGVPKCESKTNWTTLWTQPQEAVMKTSDFSNIFSPPLCPSVSKTRIIRLDFDTSRVPGWNVFDAAMVTGSLEAPPGLLFDSANRLVYVPISGIHGIDKMWFTSSDCLDTGLETKYVVKINPPPAGEFSSDSFATMTVLLDTEPGKIIHSEIDLTKVIEKIVTQTRSNDAIITGTIWHTEALGIEPGTEFGSSISSKNSTVTLPLGTTSYVPQKVELWLQYKDSNLTFRVHLSARIFVPCMNGNVDDSRGICVCSSPRWTNKDCSIEKKEDRNELPTASLVSGYSLFAILFIVICGCLVFVRAEERKGPVKAAQPFFLYIVLSGCLLSALAIVVLLVEESDVACALGPWFYSLGFSAMFGAMSAKILRVYRLLLYGTRLIRKTVTIHETMIPVSALLAVNTVILVLWTTIDPLQWTRVTKQEDGFGYILESIGSCSSRNSKPYILTLCIINAFLLIILLFLSYRARNIPSEFQEGKNISLAVFSCLEVYFIGIPVNIIVNNDAQVSIFVQCSLVFLTTLAILLLIFGPLMWKVYKGEEDLRKSQKISKIFSTGVRNAQRKGTKLRSIQRSGKGAGRKQETETSNKETFQKHPPKQDIETSNLVKHTCLEPPVNDESETELATLKAELRRMNQLFNEQAGRIHYLEEENRLLQPHHDIEVSEGGNGGS